MPDLMGVPQGGSAYGREISVQTTSDIQCSRILKTTLELISSQQLLASHDARDKLSFSVVVVKPVSAETVSESELKRGVFGGKLRIGSKSVTETQHVVFPNRSLFADVYVHEARFTGWWAKEPVVRFALPKHEA